MENFQLDGWFADFEQQNFYAGTLVVADGRVVGINPSGKPRVGWADGHLPGRLILPGLVDSHVHIESSMLMPSRFAREAVRFGTVATVSDPHEIANVLGLDGIRLMMEDAAKACIHITFTAPSCVPATSLETAGATLLASDLEGLFRDGSVVALGEMMNYPGVLARDPEVMAKIEMAGKYGIPVDGHAPGLTGEPLQAYLSAGITTDHECSTVDEAIEKLEGGMNVLIREGSSARNFNQLLQLIDQYPAKVMLCSDDLHPDDLVKGHIDRLIRRGLNAGLNFFNLYRAASLNPVSHYRLPVGMLQPGDPADFLIAECVPDFRVIATYINGAAVFSEGKVEAPLPELVAANNFHAEPVTEADLQVFGEKGNYRVIRVFDGELLTGSETAMMVATGGCVNPDISRDILKIVVVNRYIRTKPAVGWISGFGLQTGALASSITHDSHNIIAVGTSDKEITTVINEIIAHQGGIAVTGNGSTQILPLPVAGLMSLHLAAETGEQYARLSDQAKSLGSALGAPFMALSFMALLVIPHLKIGDRGLFDCDTFTFTDLKAD